VAVSGSTGIAYVADANNNRIRKVTAAGEVSTLAGDGIGGYKKERARMPGLRMRRGSL